MGRLTDDMTRLAGDIHAARGERGRLVRKLRETTIEMKRAVAVMQARFHAAHTDMAARQERRLREFAGGLRNTVASLQNAFANDLAGAHNAWIGTRAAASTGAGHGRRSTKWFGGEGV